jgi:hypothetical protein
LDTSSPAFQAALLKMALLSDDCSVTGSRPQGGFFFGRMSAVFAGRGPAAVLLDNDRKKSL